MLLCQTAQYQVLLAASKHFSLNKADYCNIQWRDAVANFNASKERKSGLVFHKKISERPGSKELTLCLCGCRGFLLTYSLHLVGKPTERENISC